MWGWFAGETRKPPPQILSTTPILKETYLFVHSDRWPYLPISFWLMLSHLPYQEFTNPPQTHLHARIAVFPNHQCKL